MQPATESGRWLTLSAASSRLRWARARVESRARREEWPKRPPNRGMADEYLVPASVLTEVVTDLDGAADAVVVPPPAPSDGVMTEAVAELQAEVTVLLTEAAIARGALAAELRRSADLIVALEHERAERAAEREVHQRFLDQERARGDRLEAVLAEARKPLLVRVIEGLRRKPGT